MIKNYRLQRFIDAGGLPELGKPFGVCDNCLPSVKVKANEALVPANDTTERPCFRCKAIATPLPQAPLFESLPPIVTATGETIQERFENFHRANPHILESLVALARRAAAKNRKKIGIKMLWEVLRWNYMISTDTEEDFKLSNDFHSRYARLIAELHPELADLFDFRKLRAP